MILIESSVDMGNSWERSYEVIIAVKEDKPEDQETTKGTIQGLDHK